MYRKFIRSLLALVIFAGQAMAQNAEPLKYLAPYMDENSLLVGWVDVRNFDEEQMFSRLLKFGVEKEMVEKSQSHFRATKERVLKLGVSCFYFTLVGDPIPSEILIVVPTTNPQAVKEILADAPEFKAKVADTVLLLGSERVLKATENKTGKIHAGWTKAFAKLDDSPSQIVFMPPRTMARAFAELQPQLPPELGGGSTVALVDAFQWANIGLDLSDKFKFKLTIQAKNEAAAMLLDPLLDHAINMIKKNPQSEIVLLAKLLETHRPKQVGDQIRMTMDAQTIDTALAPLLVNLRKSAKSTQTMNHLRQIGLAMHNYHDVYKTFPAQASASKNKKLLLSWRVHILPFLAEETLYNEFHLDEPWDSEHNTKLIPKLPAMYFSPNSNLRRVDGKTTMVVPTGPKMFFSGSQKKGLQAVTDGTSSTIAVLDVDDSKAVIWTQPDDFPVEQNKPIKGHFRTSVGRIVALFFDGSVRQLSAQTPDETLWLYFCPDDGTVIPQTP